MLNISFVYSGLELRIVYQLVFCFFFFVLSLISCLLPDTFRLLCFPKGVEGGREKSLSGSGKFCLSLDGSLLSGKLICKLELEIFWQNGIEERVEKSKSF